MSKPLRYTLALVLLAASLVLLGWASLPGERVLRRQFIQPTEMQLPAPGGSLFFRRGLAWVHPPFHMACPPFVVGRFALIL